MKQNFLSQTKVEKSMNKENKELFETLSVKKAVWTLAIPTMLGMIVMVLYNLADTFFIGQTGDSSQVAAVSLGMPVFLLLMAFGNLFGIGGSTSISRNLGEGKTEKAKNISSFSCWSAFGTGVLVGALMLIFMPQITRLVGASPTTEAFVSQYLIYIAIGAPFIILSNTFGNIVRSEGAAKKAMVGMMIGTIINIVLDPIMILWMDMGVTGAAIATILGNIASTIYYIAYFRSGKTHLSISLKHWNAGNGIAKDVLAIGIPGAVGNILMSVTNVIYNNYLISYGDAPVAAMGVATKATMMLAMILIGLTQGTQPLFGYSYGAKNYHRFKASTKYCMKISIIIGIVITVVYQFGAASIIKAFINDTEVIEYGTKMLRILMTTGPVLGITFVVMSAMQAMGKAGMSLLLSVCRQGLAFIPAVIFANMLFGLDGLMWAQPVADAVSIVLSLILFIVVMKKLPQNASPDAIVVNE